MNTQMLSGAVNPYALTEAVLNKRIDWSRVERPVELVSRTLETPADALFNGGRGSPTFALQAPLKAAAPAAVAAPRLREMHADLHQNISPALRARLSELLTPKLAPELQETQYDGATWTDPGDFFEEGSEFADPVQGAVGDCWLISALASVAMSRPYTIVQRNRTTGTAQDAFVNAIDVIDAGTPKRFEVTERVPVNSGSGQPRFARSAEGGEVWPGVYEKAFAKLRSGNLTDQPDILVLHGGDCVDASARLVPGTTAHYTATNGTTADALWTQLRDNSIATPQASGPLVPIFNRVRSGRTVNPMTAWTYAKAEDAPDTIAYDANTGIVGWHAYSVLGWITRSSGLSVVGQAPAVERYIVLRNPWGTHEGRVDTFTGSFASHETSWVRNTPLGTGGVFAMRIESFKKYYAGLGVAR
ncbi:C2 family cysteine protease [Lysobacter xanthus]